MIGQWTHDWLQTQGYPVQYYPSINSTNLIAKDLAMSESAPVTFYVADSQTQGRGQGSNKWINTPAGTNLLMTCSILSNTPPQPSLCLLFGEHLKNSCLQIWPNLAWRVKAPNDLYLDNKKVAGILLESVSQGPQHRLLFGLGFNVLAAPQDPSFLATSLQQLLSHPIQQQDWQLFLDALLKNVLSESTFR
jgi:BirA family biotin operon repressor/biotin-[acetyl-CoA-carboxylase] ligase